MNEILEKDITMLHLNKDITNVLINNNIYTILNLCNHSRISLSEIGFTNDQINEIMINLQLIGLDLKRNHAKRNTILDSML